MVGYSLMLYQRRVYSESPVPHVGVSDTPKSILNRMRELPGCPEYVSTSHIKSHLQKYRQYTGAKSRFRGRSQAQPPEEGDVNLSGQEEQHRLRLPGISFDSSNNSSSTTPSRSSGASTAAASPISGAVASTVVYSSSEGGMHMLRASNGKAAELPPVTTTSTTMLVSVVNGGSPAPASSSWSDDASRANSFVRTGLFWFH